MSRNACRIVDLTTLWRNLAVFMVLLPVVTPTRAANEPSLWAALRDGRAFAMIRHALAPGFGDPQEFRLNDCSTQRNLSREGGKQARQIGELFRRNRIKAADIYTSQWCRCRETAELFGIGSINDLPALNSFFQNDAQRKPQTDALRQWLRQKEVRVPLILVTHQVNISALTGRTTGSGEIVVIQKAPGDRLRVLGSINPQK